MAGGVLGEAVAPAGAPPAGAGGGGSSWKDEVEELQQPQVASAPSLPAAAPAVAEDGPSVAVSAADAALLARVKFALGRFDFSDAAATGGASAAAPMPPPGSVLPGLSPGSEAHQLYAMFEFVRSGDTRPLLPANQQGGGAAGGAAGADAAAPATGPRLATTPAAAAAAAAGGAMAAAPSVAAADEAPRTLVRQDVVERQSNWNDFLGQLVARFPPRREVPVRVRGDAAMMPQRAAVARGWHAHPPPTPLPSILFSFCAAPRRSAWRSASRMRRRLRTSSSSTRGTIPSTCTVRSPSKRPTR